MIKIEFTEHTKFLEKLLKVIKDWDKREEFTKKDFLLYCKSIGKKGNITVRQIENYLTFCVKKSGLIQEIPNKFRNKREKLFKINNDYLRGSRESRLECEIEYDIMRLIQLCQRQSDIEIISKKALLELISSTKLNKGIKEELNHELLKK